MDFWSSKTVGKTKRDIAVILRKSWYHLRLSVRDPHRFPTWDAIVITASSPKQAELYSHHLHTAVSLGRIAPSTVIMAAPDPDGHRIGSGAATLSAIEKLAANYNPNELNSTFSENASQSLSDFVKDKHILLIHAGGDSKRVPWANPLGKVFLPLPFLASDDRDGPVPLLLDHIFAVASCARQAFKNEGGIMIMTGDVLPCFDASELILPDDSSCIITVPITPDVAANHGVVVASKTPSVSQSHPLFLVDNLLQTPNLSELTSKNAILDDGRTLLDTGVIAVRGKAWANLASLACSSRLMITDLISTSNEMGLYEELVAAWVPAKHDWLRTRPMGEQLLEYLANDKMHTFCSYDMKFKHFGTSGEVLDHLSEASSDLIERRHLSIIPANDVSDVSPSAVILSSKIGVGVSVGEDSLIFQTSLSSGTQIGPSSIVINFTDCRPDNSGNKFPFVLPPRHCVWEVRIGGENEKVLVYCGLYDNPKLSFPNGTFCGRPWMSFLRETNVVESDLWEGEEKCLWNARLFSVSSLDHMLECASWLMGLGGFNFVLGWRGSRRYSMKMVHDLVEFEQMRLEARIHNSNIAAGICKACINGGLIGRNVSKLCEQILDCDDTNCSTKDFIYRCVLRFREKRVIPKSRLYQVKYDLLNSMGHHAAASRLKQEIWSAVADETADAVRLLPSPTCDVAISQCMSTVKVELPVRVDFTGGWSDTPPWSLERTGCVLNMAIKLQGELPIGAEIETMNDGVLDISDDVGNHTEMRVEAFPSVIDKEDPFRLVKSALHVTGILKASKGLKVRTWARVPRGSGLGTSSILAAAVVKGLLQIINGDSSNEHVAKVVLVVEQLMGCGGGWQDQIGGLYGGVKLTRSFPGVPVRLEVTALKASEKFYRELKERVLVVFSGQVREGRDVLEKVVGGYLRRDSRVLSCIRRLAELARIGSEAVASGSVDELGEVIMDTWRIHVDLHPSSSNDVVDQLFAIAAPYCRSYKLLGAGGGGFALLVAEDSGSASQLARVLRSFTEYQIYEWDIHF